MVAGHLCISVGDEGAEEVCVGPGEGWASAGGAGGTHECADTRCSQKPCPPPVGRVGHHVDERVGGKRCHQENKGNNIDLGSQVNGCYA